MHPSVMEWLRGIIHPAEVDGKRVLEVGAQDVNGSPREIFTACKSSRYIGIDFAPGKGVDLVLNVKDLVSYFGKESFDVVVSTEMLEHVLDWRVAVQQMKDVLVPGGMLAITTRSPGFPFHGYPHDYWRFTSYDMRRIFEDMTIESLKDDPLPGHPGVFMKAWKYKEPDEKDVDLGKIQVANVR